MSKPLGTIIDERVRTFAESVRSGMHGFQPGKSWWIVKHIEQTNIIQKSLKCICKEREASM